MKKKKKNKIKKDKLSTILVGIHGFVGIKKIIDGKYRHYYNKKISVNKTKKYFNGLIKIDYKFICHTSFEYVTDVNGKESLRFFVEGREHDMIFKTEEQLNSFLCVMDDIITELSSS